MNVLSFIVIFVWVASCIIPHWQGPSQLRLTLVYVVTKSFRLYDRCLDGNIMSLQHGITISCMRKAFNTYCVLFKRCLFVNTSSLLNPNSANDLLGKIFQRWTLQSTFCLPEEISENLVRTRFIFVIFTPSWYFACGSSFDLRSHIPQCQHEFAHINFATSSSRFDIGRFEFASRSKFKSLNVKSL